MIIIDYKTPQKDYDRHGRYFAHELEKWLNDPGRFSSQMINMRAVSLMIMISDLLSHPLDEILHDEEMLSCLVGAEFFTKTMAICLENLHFGLNLSIVLENKLLSESTVQNWIDSVSKDLIVCTVYFIYEGAHPEYYRKYVQKKTDKQFMQMRKTMTMSDFLTCLDRSIHVFNILREKFFLPKLIDLQKQKNHRELIERCDGFNTIGDVIKVSHGATK